MFQEFYDEVLDPSLQPDVNPRYKIKDNNGKVISDDVQIELKTPVVNQGTPLNRATLSNLQGDLYTQDRSVYPDSTILDTGVPIFIFNTPLTSYEEGKIIRMRCPRVYGTYTGSINLYDIGLEEITASSNQEFALRAIDGYDSTSWNSNSDVEYQNVWLRMKFRSPIKIKKMKTRIAASGSSAYWDSVYIQGSNNGTSWTNLYTLSYQSTLTEIILNNDTEYRYYRVLGSVTSSTHSLYVYELQVTECDGYRYTFPSSAININSLGAKSITSVMSYNNDYVLRYNGSSWDIISNQIVTGNFSVTRNVRSNINIGFKPKMVIIYSSSNNLYIEPSESSNSNAYRSMPPLILTQEFIGTSADNYSGAITENGFWYLPTGVIGFYNLYYIAIG